MTRPSKAISWQYVVLSAIGAGFFLGVFVLIPADQPAGRTALLGLLVLAGQAAITHFISGRVDKVDRKVNGRMTQLLEQLEQANSRLDKHHVSRETSREEAAGEDHQP